MRDEELHSARRHFGQQKEGRIDESQSLDDAITGCSRAVQGHHHLQKDKGVNGFGEFIMIESRHRIRQQEVDRNP